MTSAPAGAGAAHRKLRVACLHGYTSNAYVFHRRCGAIRRACRDVADFHFLNGPHIVQPISGLSGLDGPEAEEPAPVDENTRIEEQPRAWWRAQDDGSYEGWDEAIRSLNEQLAELGGPVDVVMGFSQGACLAGLLAAAWEKPEIIPALTPLQKKGQEQQEWRQGPLAACIAISGFRSREPRHEPLFKEKIKTPMLCILGKQDFIVDADRSATLTERCADVRVEWHEGGHTTPSQAPWRNFLRDFLHAFQQRLDPPVEQGTDAVADASSSAPGAAAAAAKSKGRKPAPQQQPLLDWRTLPGPAERMATDSGTNTPGRSLAEAEREDEQHQQQQQGKEEKRGAAL